MADQGARVRIESAQILGEFGPLSDAAVTPLIALLSDDNYLVKEAAIHALGQIGEKAKRAVGSLNKLRKCDLGNVSRLADEALAKIQ